MRSSLLRPGRAEFFEHALGLDEKCEIVASILGASDAKSVRRLVSVHRKQPLAFFVELRSRALDEDLNVLIRSCGLNIDAIEDRLPDLASFGDFARLQQLAAEAAARGPKNYVGRT
jgi:hypothetical protein